MPDPDLGIGLEHGTAPASIAPSDSSDSEEATVISRPKIGRTRSSGFDSPLARLFGGGTGKKSRKDKDKAKGKGKNGTVSSIATEAINATGAGTGIEKQKSASKSSLTLPLPPPPASDREREAVEKVDKLEKELADVRSSQLRMEEMLAKLLNPAGDGK